MGDWLRGEEVERGGLGEFEERPRTWKHGFKMALKTDIYAVTEISIEILDRGFVN